MSISVVLPVFNEAKSIEHVISIWHQHLKRNNILHEFVICEDGSTDGTKEIVVKLKKNYPISDQSEKKRRNYSEAIIDGIIASKYNYILCIDSDGQCMPDTFLEFYYNKDFADVLIGIREPRNDPIYRIIYSKLFKIIFNYTFNNKIKDPSCAYVLAKKIIYLRLLKKLHYLKEGFWWGFSGSVIMLKLKFMQINIVHYKRYDGSTKVYKLGMLPKIIATNIIGLIKLKRSFKGK